MNMYICDTLIEMLMKFMANSNLDIKNLKIYHVKDYTKRISSNQESVVIQVDVFTDIHEIYECKDFLMIFAKKKHDGKFIITGPHFYNKIHIVDILFNF